MNTSPEMSAIGHVAVLALEAPSPRGTFLPFFIGVREGRAIEGEAVGSELVAARAELRAQERGGPRDPAMRELCARGAAGAITAGRTEMFMAAQVAARADDAASLQSSVEVWIRDESACLVELGPLLRDRGVTPRARGRGRRLAPFHVHELAGDARPHAPRMQGGLPVAELNGMASAAPFRLQGALDRREARGRGPLGRNGATPMTRDEVALGG
jgi:hypothetical protein